MHRSPRRPVLNFRDFFLADSVIRVVLREEQSKMRSVFYTKNQIDEARSTWLPRLRKYESQCREENPLPNFETLSQSEKTEYSLLRYRMGTFRPYSPFTPNFVGILHASPVGLLAANEMLGKYSSCLVFLTVKEKIQWFEQLDTVVDGWYWYLWWTVHKTIPPTFHPQLSKSYPEVNPNQFWVLVEGKGQNAIYDLYRCNSNHIELLESMWAASSCEEGTIREWYDDWMEIPN